MEDIFAMKHFTLTQLARGGLIAALYAVMALALPEISYGPIQMRLSEALVLLPRIMPEAVPGLIIGCFLANLGSPFGALDIIFGTLCTAIAAFITYRYRHNTIIAVAAPILVNGFGVSAYIAYLSKELYFGIVPMIMLSETIAVICLAIPFTVFASRVVTRLTGGIPS